MASEEPFLRVVSWNVGDKGFTKTVGPLLALLDGTKCDVLLLNEIKAKREAWDAAAPLFSEKGYSLVAWNPCRVRACWHGTAMIVKDGISASDVTTTLSVDATGIDKDGKEKSAATVAEREGRFIAATLTKGDRRLRVAVTYTPNSGVARQALKRLEWRTTVWDTAFWQSMRAEAATHGPTLLMGDLNVAARPKDCFKPSMRCAGNTKEEKASFAALTAAAGFADAWDEASEMTLTDHHTFYSTNPRMKAKEKGLGWRLDYAMVGGGLRVIDDLTVSVLDQEGSDHLPLLATVA